MKKTLRSEVTRLGKMIGGKTIRTVRRHGRKEILIQFTDGSRLFVDWQHLGLDISVTAGVKRQAIRKRK